MAEEHSLTVIDFQALQDAGFAGKNDKVKILGKGELKLKLNVTAHAFSKSAKEAIEKLEGTTVIL